MGGISVAICQERKGEGQKKSGLSLLGGNVYKREPVPGFPAMTEI